MTTRDQFLQAALNSVSQYPTVAKYVQAGDPRILAQLGAMSTMLGMLSSQVDANYVEPFLKARDSTILADATLKGILPLARACRVSLSIQNTGTTSATVDAGRRFLDFKGRVFEAEAAATILAGQTVPVTCVQLTRRTVTDTVSTPVPFYRVEVTQTDDSVYLNSVNVSVGANAFTYAPDWCNVEPGDLSYQAETDEQRRLWVMMGSDGVVGYGVQAGDVITIDVTECEGQITNLNPGASFNLENIYTIQDGALKATLGSVLDQGASPPSIADLRVLSRYPAIYDHNAVYLGEFDMLLRRYLSPVRFLSVWNEQIEEAARGANIAHINTLFVAGQVQGMTDTVFQQRVRDLISRADDSYKVVFVTLAPTAVSVSITGSVSVVHDTATVESQIRAAILGVYGDGQAAVSRGMSNPIRNRPIVELLRDQVAAFQDDLSDISVVITLPSTPLPEQFLYISDASLSVTIERASFGTGLWSQ